MELGLEPAPKLCWAPRFSFCWIRGSKQRPFWVLPVPQKPEDSAHSPDWVLSKLFPHTLLGWQATVQTEVPWWEHSRSQMVCFLTFIFKNRFLFIIKIFEELDYRLNQWKQSILAISHDTISVLPHLSPISMGCLVSKSETHPGYDMGRGGRPWAPLFVSAFVPPWAYPRLAGWLSHPASLLCMHLWLQKNDVPSTFHFIPETPICYIHLPGFYFIIFVFFCWLWRRKDA